jgi:hypothetical protein
MERLQAREGRDAKEKVAESAEDNNGKDVPFQPHHPRTILAATHSNSSSLSRP